jgi:hypothetical protein
MRFIEVLLGRVGCGFRCRWGDNDCPRGHGDRVVVKIGEAIATGGHHPLGRVGPAGSRAGVTADAYNQPMISREPTLARLVTARAQLLEPFGLTDASLSQALRLITEHRVDDADLYFQTTRAEGWSLEEGIVKSGSFSIDQGVGVRAVAGEKTAFAYSDDIS